MGEKDTQDKMTFEYILVTERRNIGYEYTLKDGDGNIHAKSSIPAEINGNPITTFLVDYAKLHEKVLNERANVKSIETKFELDD